jgi:hypothetical protein
LSSLLEHALAWAEAGFAVFPCVAGGKRPACKNGLDDATLDINQITQWWTEDPLFNIGVAPARTGCFVVDSDPPLGAETLARLCKDHGLLPDTLTIRTPRGGLHHWFTGSCPSTVQGLGPKLDTRGTGGYVLVPPSVVDGAYYEQVGDTDEIAEGPAWIAEAIAARSEATHAATEVPLDLPENVARAQQLLRNYVAGEHVAVEGEGGDSRTYQVACEVLNLGLSPSRAFDVIWDEWAPHCQPFNPEWFEGFLKSKIVNAFEYAQNDLGAWAAPPSTETFAHLAAQAPKAEQGRFYPRDETEQELRPLPSWLLPNLLPDQATAMMFGPSGHYKSFLALDISLVLASGIAGWGSPARDPVDVVYVAAEGSRGIERLRRPAWRKSRGVEHPLRFYTIDTMPLVGRPQEVVEVIEAIKARGIRPKLIVLDTLARAMAGKNENDAKDAGDFIEAVEAIKRGLGCTVLALHHTGKEEVRGARGSSAISAGLDTTIEVKSECERKLAVVHIRKQKDADIPAAPWTFQGEVVDAALVFNEIDTGTYQALCSENDPFSQVRIGSALRELAAIAVANAVTTLVLATHLCPPLASDTVEAREKAVAGFARRLALLAKSRLRAYTEGHGRDLKWFIPSLDDTITSIKPAGSDAV